MREEALDRTLWWTLYARGYGTVIRETTLWWRRFVHVGHYQGPFDKGMR